MRVLQVSFFQAEIVPILIFFALFFLVIGGGIQIGNRIKIKPKKDKPSMFAEIFAEEPDNPSLYEPRLAEEQPAADEAAARPA